jgi:integrase/recombinase XerD
MTIEGYLNRNYAGRTKQTYQEHIEKYLAEQSNPETATYQNIVDHIGKERKRGLKARTLNTMLQAIKKYYSYLQETKQRIDHPCKYLKLKDKIGKHIQLQDLFSEEELKLLLAKTKENSINPITYRNQLIISLLIHQGLKTGELLRLTVTDFHFEEGTVYIKGTANSNSRKLKLEASQMYLLQKYLQEERMKLLSKTSLETAQLILTLWGSVETGRGIPQLIESLKKFYPEKNLNPETIRQSVIANRLKGGEDLRVVQVFAGHKRTSTTERYKQTDVEALRDEVVKYHPLQ